MAASIISPPRPDRRRAVPCSNGISIPPPKHISVADPATGKGSVLHIAGAGTATTPWPRRGWRCRRAIGCFPCGCVRSMRDLVSRMRIGIRCRGAGKWLTEPLASRPAGQLASIALPFTVAGCRSQKPVGRTDRSRSGRSLGRLDRRHRGSARSLEASAGFGRRRILPPPQRDWHHGHEHAQQGRMAERAQGIIDDRVEQEDSDHDRSRLRQEIAMLPGRQGGGTRPDQRGDQQQPSGQPASSSTCRYSLWAWFM